ncbi:MAG: YihY/virulence factor BrkB family protein [Ardenticatenaceae bacterium]
MSNFKVVIIAKLMWQKNGQNNIARLGAALAYYTFASFFPLLLVLISLIGYAFSFNIGGVADAGQYVIEMVSSQLPAAGKLLEQNIQHTERNSGAFGLAGLLTGLWAASNIFAQLEGAFDVIFEVGPHKQAWLKMLKARARAALIVLLIALLMVSSLLFSTVLKTVDSLARALPAGGYWAWLLNIGISLSITGTLFAALFKYIPDKLVTWKAALIGGMFASITWQIGREVLTWWLAESAGATAGTVVGSVLAFLALIYYAWQILLLGAQLTAVIDQVIEHAPQQKTHCTLCQRAFEGVY